MKKAKQISQLLKSNAAPEQFLSESDARMFSEMKQWCEASDSKFKSAFDEYKSAKKLLPPEYSLVDAAKAFPSKRIRVESLCEKFLTQKENTLDPKYIRNMRACLKKFSNSFQKEINIINPDELVLFFNSLKLHPTTINHYKTTIKSLISYAIDFGYLPVDNLLQRNIKKKRVILDPISIISPEEFEEVFRRADDSVKGRIFLEAFCGLRASEARKWTVSRIGEKSLILDATVTKESQRRVIEVPHAALEWLKSNADPLGLNEQIGEGIYYKLKRRAFLRPAKNCLRHSCISYKWALYPDVNQITADCGTSLNMINRYYKELTDRATARRWLDLRDRITQGEIK
jgi:integrase